LLELKNAQSKFELFSQLLLLIISFKIFGKLLHAEKELIEKLKNGDSFAFEVLFYKYRSKVKGFAKRMIPSQIDLEEIVREVFVIVWLRKEYINWDEEFQTYLFCIVLIIGP